jgi:hypothetical protein
VLEFSALIHPPSSSCFSLALRCTCTLKTPLTVLRSHWQCKYPLVRLTRGHLQN